MKILWVTNTLFPDMCIELNLPISVAGGWMYGMGAELSSSDNIELFVATPTEKVNEISYIKKNNITYCLIPGRVSGQYNSKLEGYFSELSKKVMPDLVHIHGTEYAHGLAMIKSNPKCNYVVSIQGLVKEYCHYYEAGLSTFDLIKSISLKDLLTINPLFLGKYKFKIRGDLEKEYYKRVHHVIGRTDWDYVHSLSENSQLTYHFCNESLRDTFYSIDKWNSDSLKNKTIFLSQASYPIKGLHLVLQALSLVKLKHPTIQLRIAGSNLTQGAMLPGYGKLIKKLILKLNLQNNVIFTGLLDSEAMSKEYLNASVFVCPSSIENSPNSVGEAQLIGVPVIASDVGGVSNMIDNFTTGVIYRFEEFKLLAHYIDKVLSEVDFAENLSLNGIVAAKARHNRPQNLENTVNIYKKICG